MRLPTGAVSRGSTPRAAPPPDVASLTSKHKATLAAIFHGEHAAERSDVPWRSVEALFVALGGSVENGNGSGRRVALGGRRAVFHEPHPERVTDKGAVKDVRRFLESAGVRP